MNKSIRLQFKPSIPIRLENVLASFGFVLHSRKKDRWVIYRKTLDAKPQLTYAIRENLEHKLNDILDEYYDPYPYILEIRTKCMEVAEGLSGAQKEWVLGWIETNIDDELCSVPWTDEDFLPDVEGSC